MSYSVHKHPFIEILDTYDKLNTGPSYITTCIAVISVVIAALSLYLFYDGGSKINALEEEVELLKNQMGLQNRGGIAQQSIVKMSPNISSMTNENTNQNSMEKRLENIEKDVDELKSVLKSPP